MKTDHHYDNLKGILYMLLSCLAFAINDTIVKYVVKKASSDFSIFDVVFIRGIFTSIIILILILIFGKLDLKKLLINKRAYSRGLFEVFAALSFLTGLILMPMADVYTLLNTAPLIITAVGAIVLKEKVGIRRWSAVIIGFIGVLIVINPGKMEFGYLFILPIMAAIFLTLRDLITKGFHNTTNSLEIIFITSFMVMIGFGIISIFFPTYISYENIFYIICSSVFLVLGYLFSVLTIFYAPLSLTSSTRYSVIVFGIILGYFVLGEIPRLNMIFGALVISLSGIFVIKREKELGKIN